MTDQISRLPISRREALKVFYNSDGMCAFPDCNKDLADLPNTHNISPSFAHIIGATSRGPRGDDDMPPEERAHSSNLLLLCDLHHRMVDVMPVTEYTAARLRDLKSKHEALVAARRRLGSPLSPVIGSPLYINLPRIILDSACSSETRRLFSEFSDMDDLNIGSDNMRVLKLMTSVQGLIPALEQHAIRMLHRDDIRPDRIGARFIFWRVLRTKNVFDRNYNYRQPTGNLETDPMVYAKLGTLKVIMPIDPRWVTSNTARTMFGQGSATLAGIGRLRLAEQGRALMSPLVIALPSEQAVYHGRDFNQPHAIGADDGKNAF